MSENKEKELIKMMINATIEQLKNPYNDNNFLNDEEYGLVPNKPIMTNLIQGSESYLNNLTTCDGKSITSHRECSIDLEGISGVVDKYNIYSNGEKVTDLYLNMYGKSTSIIVPKGFKRKQTKVLAKELDPKKKPLQETTIRDKQNKTDIVINNKILPICKTDEIKSQNLKQKSKPKMRRKPEAKKSTNPKMKNIVILLIVISIILLMSSIALLTYTLTLNSKIIEQNEIIIEKQDERNEVLDYKNY